MIREENSLSIEEFSVKLAVPLSTTKHIESGRNLPNIQFVAKLHQHFPQYSLEYILYGENPGQQEPGKEVDFTAFEIRAEDYELPDIGLLTQCDLSERVAEEGVSETQQRIADVLRQCTPSLIQRKFSIGYGRAGRIMDRLEHSGSCKTGGYHITEGNDKRNKKDH